MKRLVFLITFFYKLLFEEQGTGKEAPDHTRENRSFHILGPLWHCGVGAFFKDHLLPICVRSEGCKKQRES